jgi:hypothetical protein
MSPVAVLGVQDEGQVRFGDIDDLNWNLERCSTVKCFVAQGGRANLGRTGNAATPLDRTETCGKVYADHLHALFLNNAGCQSAV